MRLEDWLDFAAELGLDCVDCRPLLLRPMGQATSSDFRRLAESLGLAIRYNTAYSDFAQPDASARKRELVGAPTNLPGAQEPGSPSLRAPTGQQRPEVSLREGLERTSNFVGWVAEAAFQAGPHLNAENHARVFSWNSFDFALKSEVLLAFLNWLHNVPVAVQFDIANP